MTLKELSEAVAALNRGEYEHWAFDPKVDYQTACALLRQQVNRIAWQPWARAEVGEILSQLREEE